jgi:hypothetical protein
MDTATVVSELLPTAVEPGAMTDRDLRDYEAALNAFGAGQWQTARDLLQRLADDGPAEFLKAFMDRHQQNPPSGWDGVISLESE